ncbi:hypothetical protein G4177_22710 [Corallococcus sp. ZKHCc1 1396]|uniref:Uncharacterized protein n=1 Tax=Corallococcus soli TaxID=2710757 RepID=A0ABR9PST9_9BACT|nr:hypothetical protein [Corallococcus soli]MBE4750988.1 hypothetical protein [Corallococcus soli]
MVHHGQRVGLFMALTVAAVLLGTPAHAEGKAKQAQAEASTGKADAGAAGEDGGAAALPETGDAKGSSTAKGSSRCSGKATFCGVYSRTFCSSQPGCYYMFATNMCGGLPIKCETATNEAYCTKIKGCSWK